MNVLVINIIIWVITILLYIIYNLWRRSEKLEAIAKQQSDYIKITQSAVNQITKSFDRIDEENIFRSNDYVGQMWLELKSLNEQLKNFK
jgi:uncharacterized membrane protein YukC